MASNTKARDFIKKIADDKTFDFRNFPEAIGAFEQNSVQLYDLSIDPSESDNQFSKGRFKDVAKDMYDFLAVKSKDLGEMIFYLDDNRDIENSKRDYNIPGLEDWEGNQINKWRPWLDETGEEKFLGK